MLCFEGTLQCFALRASYLAADCHFLLIVLYPGTNLLNFMWISLSHYPMKGRVITKELGLEHRIYSYVQV